MENVINKNSICKFNDTIRDFCKNIRNSILFSLNNMPERRHRNTGRNYGTGGNTPGAHVFRGLVTALVPVGRYRTKFQKVTDAIFSGIPYTIGYSAYSMRFRVEKIDEYGRYTDEIRDYIFYGDIEGALQLGSEVSVRSDSSGNVKSILVHDTGREYHPKSGYSVIIIRLAAIFAASLSVIFIASVLNGSLFASIGMLVAAVAPYIVCFALVYYIFRGIIS